MTPAKITALVDRGIAIYAEMKGLKEELAGIEKQLKAAGLEGKHTELKDADREGRRFEAHGSRAIVPVVFTADALVKTFSKDSETHLRIAEASDGRLLEFYTYMPSYESAWKDGKEFRAAADERPACPAAFITACLQRGKGGIPKSSVKVEWEEAMASLGHAEAQEVIA